MNSPTGSATATVETLTAEVKVLQVGNRQITLSVAKQLDWVPLKRLRPFGRVKIGGDLTTVIGSDLETGSLSLSEVRPSLARFVFVKLKHRPGALKPLRCRKNNPSNRHGAIEHLVFGPDKFPLELDADDMEDRHSGYSPYGGPCYTPDCETESGPRCTGYHCTDQCKFWDPRDYYRDIASQVELQSTLFNDDQRLVKEAKELPLIVLAGLR